MNAVTIIPTAGVADLAARIRAECEAVARAMSDAVSHAREAGRLLREAKQIVGHGGWGAWLKANFELSDRTARAWMQLADEWEELDEPNRQRVAEMSLREALSFIAKTRDALPYTGNTE